SAQRDMVTLNLPLALAQKPGGDNAEARRLLRDLVKPESLKTLRPAAAAAVLLAHARAQDDTPAGRLARVQGYTRLVEQARTDPAGLSAALLDREVVRGLLADNGQAVFGGAPGPELAPAAARLYAAAGAHVRRYPDAWAAVPGAADRPADLAVKLLDRAVALDPRPEYRALRGIARSEEPQPDVAALDDDATAALGAPDLPGGHALSGVVDTLKADRARDGTERVARREAADREFRAAIRLAQKLAEARPDRKADAQDELLLAYDKAANNCL